MLQNPWAERPKGVGTSLSKSATSLINRYSVRSTSLTWNDDLYALCYSRRQPVDAEIGSKARRRCTWTDRENVMTIPEGQSCTCLPQDQQVKDQLKMLIIYIKAFVLLNKSLSSTRRMTRNARYRSKPVAPSATSVTPVHSEIPEELSSCRSAYLASLSGVGRRRN